MWINVQFVSGPRSSPGRGSLGIELAQRCGQGARVQFAAAKMNEHLDRAERGRDQFIREVLNFLENNK